MMLPALAALAGYALAKTDIQLPGMPTKTSPSTPAGPDVWAKVCPVDPHMPSEPSAELNGKSYRDCTREAWRTGTEEELRALAAQIRNDYPVAAGTLLLRADDLHKREEAAAKVTPIRKDEKEKGAI